MLSNDMHYLLSPISTSSLCQQQKQVIVTDPIHIVKQLSDQCQYTHFDLLSNVHVPLTSCDIARAMIVMKQCY